MNCPDCSGPMWDNTQDKQNPKSPDYKCKNKQCGKAVWLKPKAGGGNGSPRPSNGATKSQRPLGPLYRNCLQIARHVLAKELPNAQPADILAATATLFIAASRDGTPLVAPTPKPAPPPPPPPEPEYDERDDDNFSSEDAIPF